MPEGIEAPSEEDSEQDIKPKKNLTAYPPAWAETFGRNFYRHVSADDVTVQSDKNPIISAESRPYRQPDLKVTDIAIIGKEIKTIIADMKEDVKKDA